MVINILFFLGKEKGGHDDHTDLPGSEYVIAHLHDKYCKNLTVTTIRQSGQVLIAFLLFFQGIVIAKSFQLVAGRTAQEFNQRKQRMVKINGKTTGRRVVRRLRTNDLLPGI